MAHMNQEALPIIFMPCRKYLGNWNWEEVVENYT